MDEKASATAIIGLLVGFLVVGVVGIYVGDQLIAATDLSGTSHTDATNATVGTANETIGAGITSIDFTLVGGGGGGGSGDNVTMTGGAHGTIGTVNTQTDIAVTAGQWINYTIGGGGLGGVAGAGADGTKSTVYVNGVAYAAALGAGGAQGTAATVDGADGDNGYGTSGTTGAASAGSGMVGAGAAGAGATGRGAGGAGGGAGAVAGEGDGGRGVGGVIEITYYTTAASLNPMYGSQQGIVETFALGVTLCKIIVIVSIASIVFMLLQRTGLIPRFGGGEGGSGM